MPIDFDATVLAANLAAFGESVTYTPANGSPLAISGVFDPSYTFLSLNDEGVAVTVVKPALGIRVSSLPQAPDQDDLVTARGINYIVREARIDGHGHAHLLLNRTA